MSGGVDSSVTAALLKYGGFSAEDAPASGWDVCGVHIKMWSDPEIPCMFKEDRYDAMKVAAVLNIPFETWDLTDAYKQGVVEYMISEYASGRTPNPDVMCNRKIKFGIFLKRALAEGADFVATGHYVTLKVKSEKLKTHELATARDLNKDQSYFLWTLGQKQLKHCLFPIGKYTKPEVRVIARKFGLPTAEKKDSQGICFIGEINVKEFLKKHIRSVSGSVVTTQGKMIGTHEGLSFYTMGQREGLGVGGGTPYYVAKKDFLTNTLVVGEGPYDKKLFSRTCGVVDTNWISGKEPKFPLACAARIRYRQPLQECRVFRDGSKITAKFKEDQRAVTPGQSIVFYMKNTMIGGGIICE